jgi:hypothetical protein
MLLTTNRGSCDRFHAALPPFYLGRGKQENADRTVVPAHHTIRITSCCEFKRYWCLRPYQPCSTMWHERVRITQFFGKAGASIGRRVALKTDNCPHQMSKTSGAPQLQSAA